MARLPPVPDPRPAGRRWLTYAVPTVLALVTIAVARRGASPHWGGLAAMAVFYLATYWLGVWA